MSNHNSSFSSLNRSTRSIGEFSPSYEKIFVPTNKETVYVYQKGCAPTSLIDNDEDDANSSFSSLRTSSQHTHSSAGGSTSKSHFKGEWQVQGYTATSGTGLTASPKKKQQQQLHHRRKPDEVWIFRDDDPNGIDDRVLMNQPSRGRWGYGPTVTLKPHMLAKSITVGVNTPADMWFFPPHVTSGFPDGFQPLGDWIKPVYHKDLSILSPGQSGFFTVGKGGTVTSGNSPAPDSGFGTSGKWKMYGHNDQTKSSSAVTTAAAAAAAGPTKLVVKKKKKVAAASDTLPPKSPMPPNKKKSPLTAGVSSLAAAPTGPKTPTAVTTPTTVPKQKIRVGGPIPPASPSSTFQVHIRKPGGGDSQSPSSSSSSTFAVQVQPSYRLIQLKQKINRSRGLPLEVIQLSFKGKEVGMTASDDKVTLQSLGIKNDDILDLAGIQLYIRTAKGKKFLFSNTDPEISVTALKELVAAKEGTPVPDQQLIFMNQLLEDGDPISKYKIKNKASIDLQPSGTLSGPPPRAKKMIVIKKGPAPKEPAAAASTLDGTKAKAETISTVSSAAVPVTTKKKSTTKKKTPTTSTAKTPATLLSPAGKQKKPAASVKSPSRVVATTASLPDEALSLATPVTATKKSATKNKSSTMIAPPNLGDSMSSLSLLSPSGAPSKSRGTIRLLNCDKSTVKVSIDVADTLPDVQRKVSKKIGLPGKLVCLLDAKGREALTDESYTFVDGATFRLAPVVAVTNSQSNESIKMSVTPDISTIKDLKLILEDRMGIPAKEQELYFDDNDDEVSLLDDDTRIDKNMNLILEVATNEPEEEEEEEVIQVTVKTLNGKNFVLDIQADDEEKNVLQKIANKAGVPIQLLRLMREDDGAEVDTDNYMIKDGDVLVVGKPNVTIQTSDGQVMNLELDVGEASSFVSLRRKIAKETGIPVSDLRLSNNVGEVSNDNLPKNGERLVIAPPRITIQTPDGETFRLDVESCESAQNLKARIANETGVAVSDLRLSVNDHSMTDNYFPSYGDVVTIAPPRILVTTPEGKILHIDVYPDDSARDVRRKIAKEAHIPLDKLNISVNGEEVDEDYLPVNGAEMTIEPPPSIVIIELPDGEKLEFEAAPTTTIGEIKEILNDETGTQECDQELFIIGGDGVPLNNAMVVDKDASLVLKIAAAKEEEPTTISVTVTSPDGQVYKLEVEQFEIAGNVFKRKVAKEIGMQVKNFRLSVDDIEVDKNFVAKNGDKFSVAPITKVAVKTSKGRIFNLDINPGDTAFDIRERISKEAGIPEKGLLLSVNGEELRRDSIPFHGDLLVIEPPSMTVVTPDGKSLKIDIEVSESHKFMRRKTARILGIPMSQLRLSKGDKEVEHDFFPSHGDVLSVMETTTFSVQLPDSSTSDLPYSKNLTIGGLKTLVEEESGIKKADQCVSTSQGEKQLDDSVLVDNRIKYRMEIAPEPFTITICTPDEQMLSLDLSSCASAHDARELIAHKIGLPVKELSLSKDEEELDEDYMPSNGDHLTVQPPTVTVRLPNGSNLELSAPPSTTIVDIKEALEDELGINTTEQRLLQQETGEEMANDMPIERNLDLTLEVSQKPFTVTVNSPDEQVFALEVGPSDSAEDVKSKIAKLVGIPVEEVRLSKDEIELEEDYLPKSGDEIDVEPPMITVQLPNGSVLELSALPTTTFRDLKETLEEEMELNADDQRLYLLKGDTELAEDAIVKHMMALRLEVRQDSDVKTQENTVRNTKVIIIRPRADETFSIYLGNEATIKEVKNAISVRVGIDVHELRLVMDENEDEGELDDTFVPSDGDVLAVGAPTVKVQLPSGDEVELEVLTTTSIRDVKETLEDETGIPAARQRLFFVDSDGNEMVDDMLIEHDLHLKLEEVIEVKVRNVDGCEFSLEMSSGTTYEKVREEVASRISSPSSEVRLLLNGANLDKNYIPSKGDVLTVESPNICVQLPEGTKLFIPVNPKSTIADLKRSVEGISGLASASQKITFQDESGLADETLLSLPKFFEGNILKVRLEIPEVTINTHDGRSFVMKMDPKDTRNDVRHKVAKEIGFLTQDLRLSKDGAPLDKKYKPKTGDVLTVEGQRIKVDLPDGARIEISVMPTQSIEEVKDVIAKMSGISKTEQMLFFANGKAELDDSKAVSKYGLDESLVLEVRLPDRPPAVTVRLPDGNSFELDLDQGKSVGQVKAAIIGRIGVPVGSLEFNGKSLQGIDESKTLRELGVIPKDGDELHVGSPSMEVKLPDGRKMQFDILSSTTIADLKHSAASKLPKVSANDLRVLDSSGLNPLDDAVCFANANFLDGLWIEMEPIMVLVKVPGTTEPVSVALQPHDTIGQLKDTLVRDHNLDTKSMLLFQDGKELNDSLRVSESDIRKGSYLEMEIFQFQVTVNNASGTDTLTFNDFPRVRTIGQLKLRLTAEKHIAPDKQRLLLDYNLLDDDNKTLQECGVKHMSALVLETATEKEVQISVEHWDGEVFTLDVKSSDSIGRIKEQIAILTKIPIDQQTLLYESIPVEDSESVHELGINDGSKLKLQSCQIYVQLPNGVKQSISVDLDYKIEKVKEILSTVTLLDIDDQNLIIGEEHVGNGSTLRECGVKIGDTVMLEPYLVSVLCWSGDIVDLEGIRGKDTIDMVKDVLFIKKSVAKDKQRIMRGGEALDDSKKTLACYGVRHKDTLMLDNPDKIEKSGKNGKSPFSFLQKATTLLTISKPIVGTDANTIEDSQGTSIGSPSRQSVTITVITPELQSVKLDIDINITPSEFREKVAEGVGVDLDDLRLSKFGEPLDDTYTPIAEGEILTVEPPPTVTVHLPDGSKLELAASLDTTIEDIKDCLEDETGVTKVNQKLFIMKGTDEVEVNDNVVITEDIELHLKVSEGRGIRDAEAEDGYELVVEERVEYEEISVDDNDESFEKDIRPEGSDKARLRGSPKRSLETGKAKGFKTKPMEIFVKDVNGMLHTILVNEEETTVEDLKYKVPSHSCKDGNMADQCIIMNGKELDPSKTLQECRVTEGEMLKLESYALQIMHFMSVILPLDSVSRLDTIGAVKEKLAVQQSIPKNQQKISIQGKNVVLDNNSKTLKDYGIEHMTVLILQEDSGSETKPDSNQLLEDADEKAKNLDDRIAKIKERAEARKMARSKSGR